MAVRMAVLVKTTVGRARQVATVKGLKRKAAATAQGGHSASLRVEGATEMPVEAMVMRARAEKTSRRM